MAVAYICDIILVLLLIAAIVNSTKTGFVQSIIGLFLGIINITIIVAFLNPVRSFLLKFINLSKIVGDTGRIWKNYILAASNYLIVTIFIFLVLSVISYFIMFIAKRKIEDKRIDSPTFLKWDRGLGFVAGLIRGVVTCAIISIIISQPLFFPSMQSDVKKTTITSFTYNTTKKVLVSSTNMDDETLTNVMIAYFMGSDISTAKEETSTYRTLKMTSFIMDLPSLINNPQEFVDENNQEGLTKYIIYISAIADITAMSPKNEDLDKKFIKLYDYMVSFIPEGVLIPFEEGQYEDMFNTTDGSFYKVSLDEEKINKLKDISCNQVCYVDQ